MTKTTHPVFVKGEARIINKRIPVDAATPSSVQDECRTTMCDMFRLKKSAWLSLTLAGLLALGSLFACKGKQEPTEPSDNKPGSLVEVLQQNRERMEAAAGIGTPPSSPGRPVPQAPSANGETAEPNQ